MADIPFIAIIDDDSAICEALCELLMVTGLTCRTFDSASAFFAEADVLAFDCVITDIRMPGMSGLDLLRRLRDEGHAVPVIVVSSVADEQSKARARELGAQAWLMKPVADDTLLDQLELGLPDFEFAWRGDDARS